MLTAAEAAGFEILITPDTNMRHQQNLKGRKIAVIVLGHAQWPVLRHYVHLVVAALDSASPGGYTEVRIPHRA